MFLKVEKTNEEISADILREMPSTYQKSVGFMAWDYARAIAIGGFEKIYDLLKYLCSFGDINNFKYDDLVKFVFQRRGIRARVASYAKGSVTVTGSGTVKVGDLFQTEAGMQFKATETKTITESGTIAVECVTAGIDGNVPEKSIAVIPVSIAGIATVTNESAMTGGYDKESKESIIERYLEDIQQPITSNNKNHYKKWAKEVTGVGDAKIKPLWDGDNTVKVVIINTDNGIADSALVNSVQKYIDPFGYQVTNGTLTGYVQEYKESGKVPTGTQVFANYDLNEVLATAQENEYSYATENTTKKFGWGHGNGEADIGAYVTVESAKAKELEIAVKIILQSGAVLADVKANIQAEIESYLKEIVFASSYVSYAKIGACILKADGVLDYEESSFTINGEKDNVILIDSDVEVEIGVLKALTVTVE